MSEMKKLNTFVLLLILVDLIALCELRNIPQGSTRNGSRRRLLRSGITCPSGDMNCLEDKIQRAMRSTERRIIKRLNLQNQQNQTQGVTKLWSVTRRELEEVRRDLGRQEDEVNELVEELQRTRIQLVELQEEASRLRGLNSTVQELLGRVGRDETGAGGSDEWRPDDKTPADCQAAYDSDVIQAQGRHSAHLQPMFSRHAFEASCRVINNTAWTVIQRRLDGSVDFFRDWDEYKTGFGNLDGEFWLGNDHIFQLTNQGDYRLRIEMQDWDGEEFFAEYDHFKISSEADKYRLHISGYHGNAGDSLTSRWSSHDGKAFSTRDSDNDDRFYDNCADFLHGAWWFTNCFESHLNGVYYDLGQHENLFVSDGILWNGIHSHSSLQRVEMMIRTNEAGETDIPNGIV